MSYRKDTDLEFLQELPNEQLEVLVKIVTEDPKDKSPRFTEELTTNELYKSNSPNHHAYWFLVAAEIQCFGGNTLANIFRGGEGVLYREVLIDVAEKMKVNFNDKSSTQVIEANLLQKVMEEAVNENDSMENLLEMAKNLNLKVNPNMSKAALIAAIQAGIKLGGFATYTTALIVANAIARLILGRGLTFAANAGLTRLIGAFAGPIGWAVTGLWTLVDIASPAFRVTMPAVCYVAAMRAVHEEQKKEAWRVKCQQEQESQNIKDAIFHMIIEDVFSITGRGIVVTGKIDIGKVAVMDSVCIEGVNSNCTNVIVTGVEKSSKLYDEASAGENVGILLRGIEKSDISKGMKLCKYE